MENIALWVGELGVQFDLPHILVVELVLAKVGEVGGEEGWWRGRLVGREVGEEEVGEEGGWWRGRLVEREGGGSLGDIKDVGGSLVG